jgi:MFS family permease
METVRAHCRSLDTSGHLRPLNAAKSRDGGLQEFRNAWRPLIACSVGLGLGLSPLPPFSAGIMATALGAKFGWPRAEIMGTLMIVPFMLVFLGRYVGRLVDRFGARAVAIASTGGLGLAQFLLAAVGSNLIAFYIGWGLLAILGLGTLPMTYAKVINSWFVQSRGTALGVVLALSALGGVIIPFLLTSTLERFGWRGGYVALGMLPLLVALPVLVAWLKEAPTDVDVAGVPAHAGTGMSVREALTGYRFWALALGALSLASGVSAITPNLFPLLIDHGMAKDAAAQALAGLAISVTIGRLISGFLLDRLWAPLVCALMVLPATFCLNLLADPTLTGLPVMAAVVTLGLIAGAEFDLVAFMTARYFGERHFSELYGMQFAAFGIGAGFAPAISGAIHDRVGSYTPVLHVAIGLLIFSIIVILTLGRYPKREQDVAAGPGQTVAATVRSEG